MIKRTAAFGIAALLLITTLVVTPALGQVTVTISNTTRAVTVPVVNVTNTTRVVTVPTVNVTRNNTTTATASAAASAIPGFEAVFAIAGLLAVAFLVLRKRR